MIIEHSKPGNRARVLENGGVEVLGLFRGVCNSRKFIVLRTVLNMSSGRKVYYHAISEVARRDGTHYYIAGMIDSINWDGWCDYYYETDKRIFDRMVRRKRWLSSKQ